MLDVGAGKGALVSELASMRASCVALERKPVNLPGVEWVGHDLNTGTLPFADSCFDAVVSTEVLEHLRMQYAVLREMVRVLRPGGLLLISIPNYWNIRYRIRYLLTGNLQSPFPPGPATGNAYMAGVAPHINTFTYPALKSILGWEGCDGFRLRCGRTFNAGQRLAYLPWFMPLWTVAVGRERRGRLMLDETNSPEVLWSRRHILIACNRTNGRKPAADPGRGR